MEVEYIASNHRKVQRGGLVGDRDGMLGLLVYPMPPDEAFGPKMREEALHVAFEPALQAEEALHVAFEPELEVAQEALEVEALILQAAALMEALLLQAADGIEAFLLQPADEIEDEMEEFDEMEDEMEEVDESEDEMEEVDEVEDDAPLLEVEHLQILEAPLLEVEHLQIEDAPLLQAVPVQLSITDVDHLALQNPGEIDPLKHSIPDVIDLEELQTIGAHTTAVAAEAAMAVADVAKEEVKDG